MKKIFLLFLSGSSFCFAQKVVDSLKINDLEIPNSPALTLLDKSFSLIESSNSTNSVNANLVNIKDNSLEVMPYWLQNKKKFVSSNGYYGFTTNANNVIIKQNIFNDFIKKTSFSLAYTSSDTLTSISFGIRSNIITVKSLKKINEVMANELNFVNEKSKYIKDNREALIKQLLLKAMEEPKTKETIDTLKKDPDENKLSNFIQQLSIQLDIKARETLETTFDKDHKDSIDKLKKNYNKYFNLKRFTLDIATGGSSNFPGNQNDTGRLGRYGVWSTAKYSMDITEDDFLNIYGYGRFLSDQTQIDATNSNYVKNQYLDLGGKLEFQFKKVSVAGEYINRNGDGKDHRLVGLIQYKINDNLFLSGGYGKNFETDSGTLLTLFGLKWGLSEKAKVKFD